MRQRAFAMMPQEATQCTSTVYAKCWPLTCRPGVLDTHICIGVTDTAWISSIVATQSEGCTERAVVKHRCSRHNELLLAHSRASHHWPRPRSTNTCVTIVRLAGERRRPGDKPGAGGGNVEAWDEMSGWGRCLIRMIIGRTTK
jgi:hypothetical protein